MGKQIRPGIVSAAAEQEGGAEKKAPIEGPGEADAFGALGSDDAVRSKPDRFVAEGSWDEQEQEQAGEERGWNGESLSNVSWAASRDGLGQSASQCSGDMTAVLERAERAEMMVRK